MCWFYCIEYGDELIKKELNLLVRVVFVFCLLMVLEVLVVVMSWVRSILSGLGRYYVFLRYIGEVFDREIGFFNFWVIRISLDKIKIGEREIERSNKKRNDSKIEVCKV